MYSTREMIRRNRAMGDGTEAMQGLPGVRADGLPPVGPLPVAEEKRAENPASGQAVQRVIVPRPVREHSVYRQLMRSHDRVATRHLKG